MFRFSILANAFLIAVTIGYTAEPEKSWVGETVLSIKVAKEIKFGDRVGDKQVYFPLSGHWPYNVREDRDGWLRIHDGNREGWVLKSEFVLARESIDFFSKRLEQNPKDGHALLMRGGAWIEKKESDKAIQDFSEYIRLHPSESSGYNSRAIALSQKKEYDKAIQDYTEAIRLKPKIAITYYNRGLTWNNKADYEKAIKDFDESIKLDPNHPRSFYQRGISWRNLKDYEKALKDYDESIRQDPKYSYSYYSRGVVHYLKKDYDKAVQDYDEAIRLNPKYSFSFLERGITCHVQKKYDKAIKDFEEAIRLNPKLTSAYNHLCWIFSSSADEKYRDSKRALMMGKKAVELSERAPASLDALGAAYAESGDFEKAIENLKDALKSATYSKQYGVSANKRLKLYEQNQPYRE